MHLLVMFKTPSTGVFRRSVRDAKNTDVILKTLEFPANEPQVVEWSDYRAIKDDMYKALVPVEPLYMPRKQDTDPLIPNGKLGVIDPERFEKLVAENVKPAVDAAADPAPETPSATPEPATPPVVTPKEQPNGKKPAGRS